MAKFNTYKKGQYQGAEFNKLIKEVERQSRLSTSSPLELVNGPMGPSIRFVAGEPYLCTPIVTDVRCEGGMLRLEKMYLRLPTSLGATVGSTPCSTSSSSSSATSLSG